MPWNYLARADRPAEIAAGVVVAIIALLLALAGCVALAGRMGGRGSLPETIVVLLIAYLLARTASRLLRGTGGEGGQLFPPVALRAAALFFLAAAVMGPIVLERMSLARACAWIAETAGMGVACWILASRRS